MDYVQITESQREQMLAAIGVNSIEDLYASLPQRYRLGDGLMLEGLPRGLTELELSRRLEELAGANRAAAGGACFLGAGCYDHFIPAVVDYLAGQSAFVTAYTPYQAEASQGALQAFFEFQTQVSRLAGLDVANASLYEGATAVAEAVNMALGATGKRQIVMAETVHPDYRAVVRNYLSDLPAKLIEIPPTAQRVTDGKAVAAAIEAAKGDVAAVVAASPNVYGLIEDWGGLFAAAKAAGALAVAVFNPIACGLLKRPGECGADIAVAEGQPLGIPMQFGGPSLGLMAARPSLLRKMPGRLVGQTTDAAGRRGFCLTLQTREQHIRGAKATSNICTNQGLMAIRATIYLSAMGEAGLREVAEQCYHKAHHAAGLIAKLPGYSLAHGGKFFHEFVVNCPVAVGRITEAGRAKKIMPGVDCSRLGIGSERQMLVAVTEKRTAGEIEGLVELLKEVGSQA